MFLRNAFVGWIYCTALFSGAVHSDETNQTVWTETSENGIFIVTLDSQAEKAVQINEFLEWIITIETSEGEAVTPARITVGGGMPMHGHGLPSQPQVSEHLGDGKYLLKGLMFSMKGKWTIDLNIQSKSLSDQVSFKLKLDY